MIDGGEELIFRWPLDSVDHDYLDGALGGFQFQAELTVEGREKIRFGRLVRRWRDVESATELSFVGQPLQIEIVSSGQSSLIHYGTVHHAALHHGGELRHGCIASRKQNAVGEDGDNQVRKLIRRRGAF